MSLIGLHRVVRITWQTGATSEHRLQRKVRSYADCAGTDLLERRIREMNAAGRMDHEIAAALNDGGIMSARGTPFLHGTVHLLRKEWGIRTPCCIDRSPGCLGVG